MVLHVYFVKEECRQNPIVFKQQSKIQGGGTIANGIQSLLDD